MSSTKSSTHQDKTNLMKRLDKLQWSSWHTQVALSLGTGWAMDAYETQVAASAISLISSTFQVDDEYQQSLISSVWTFGGMFGALLFGWICDSYGRKSTFMLTLIMYSIGTLITSLAPNFIFFLIFRGLTSAPVAAEYSAVTASVAEFVPSKYRGPMTTLILGLWALGSIAATGVNALVLPLVSESIGWRITFSLGSVAAVFVLWARKKLPESPRYLLQKGRIEEAENIVSKIEILAKQPNNGLNVEPVPYKTLVHSNPMSQILSLVWHFPLTTLFACLLDLSQAFGGYGVASFMSVSLKSTANLPTDQLPMIYFIGSLCTIPATLVTVLLIDRWGRKAMLPFAYFIAAITAGLLYPAALSQNLTWFYAAYGLYQFGYTLAWNTSYPMYPELFPTQYRATGIGLAVAVGRFGGIFAPFVLTAAYNSSEGGNAGLAIGVVMSFFLMTTLMSVPYAYYGVEASGKSLEEIQS